LIEQDEIQKTFPTLLDSDPNPLLQILKNIIELDLSDQQVQMNKQQH
jgi:hypothetical protein